MFPRWVAVIRGAKKPLVVDFTSSMALVLGTELSELIPTLWAKLVMQRLKIAAANSSRVLFFIKTGIGLNNLFGVKCFIIE